MNQMKSGSELDGFRIGRCIHSGAMALIYEVEYAQGAATPGFPMVMKVPRMTAGDGAENIIGFEVEHQLMSVLTGPHVPRLVAAGDLSSIPYLVMEYVQGQTLEKLMRIRSDDGKKWAIEEVVRLGTAIATAVHSLHQQNVCHHDLKPANVLVRSESTVVLLDFGLSCHGHYPDLLAEELRKGIGSPAWIAPEQVVGIRGDTRSDIFAIGVMLYELLTSELPFGEPETASGLRQRLWMDPKPPKALRADAPDWLQEVVLKCLEHEAANRYATAAHLAFDLKHPQGVSITERGRRTRGTGFREHFRRWIRAAGAHYQPSPKPSENIASVPIVMVAIPNQDVTDATLFSLREATRRSLGIRPGAKLACVTVVSPSQTSSTEEEKGETQIHRHYLSMLRQWTQGIDLQHHQTSYHVLEASDVADALVQYAKGNHVSMIVMGAATHGLLMQRLLITVPIKVAMEAPCTVVLVKQHLPFEQLGAAA